jgi:hypothetical protein
MGPDDQRLADAADGEQEEERKNNICIGIKHELRVREREKANAFIPC